MSFMVYIEIKSRQINLFGWMLSYFVNRAKPFKYSLQNPKGSKRLHFVIVDSWGFIEPLK